jgi:hypothetical protein
MVAHVMRRTNPIDPLSACCVYCGAGDAEIMDGIVSEYECLGFAALELRRVWVEAESRRRFEERFG